MGAGIIRDLLIVFAVAIPIVLVAHRLNLPSIVGFILTGILIGPEGFGLISDAQRIDLLAEVGIALLLFHIGLEFSAGNLKGLKKVITGSGILQILLTIIAGFLLGGALGWPVARGIFFGCAAALSSTAIALAFLSYKRWLDSPAGRIATGILIIQDLAIIPMLVFLPLIISNTVSFSEWRFFLTPFFKVAIVFGLFLLVHRFFLNFFLHQVSRLGNKELFIIILLGVALGFAWFTERLGLSFALGAFLGGLMMSATPFRFHALSEIAPFKACISGLFFVSVGMLISPSFIVSNLSQITALVFFIIIAKTIISAVSVFLFGYPLGVAIIVGMLLGQMGEFSFLLVRVGLSAGVIGRELHDLLIAASGVTIVLAPIMMELSNYCGSLFGRFSSFSLRGKKEFWRKELEGFKPLTEHAIICGFGPLGGTVGHMLEKSGIDYVVLELNPITARRLIQSRRNAYVGDGASAELLSHSGISRAKLLAIAVPDYINALAIVRQARRLNPRITIVTRSRYRDQVEGLYSAGADIVVCEELEGGVEMGRYVLMELGVSEDNINSFISEIRAFGSADFF